MPTLPTVTITDAQADRCLAAWGSVAAYREWLVAQVRGYVQHSERQAALEPLRAQLAAAQAALEVDDPMAGAS